MTDRDDLGTALPAGRPVRRVVSLVPSLTEAVATSAPDLLVGATDWCTHPADLAVSRVRGTKNPDLAAIRALSPDLVIANREENRELDVRRLREAGLPVWVTVIETVDEALESMRRLFELALSRPVPEWLRQAATEWAGPDEPPRARVAIPIWRDPWMVVGARTFTGSLLRRAGLVNVFEESDDRYPHVAVPEIDTADPDLVLLPDEPYRFTAQDGPEAFPGRPCALVDGRTLTWYGPSLVGARSRISQLGTG